MKTLAAPLLVLLMLSALAAPPVHAQSGVRVWEEPLVVPTYLPGPPEPNPVFYAGRAYQGAKGPVYPYPFLDRLTDQKVDTTYRAVYLENKYLKICVLPEIGGRIFSAVDKINNYDFVYRQHVIKPALIGMLGAWISGGVEWNIPHHHRATTFMEVDHAIATAPDGSATVWVGEIELRDRMKWLVGLTLRPDRAALDVTVKVENRTPLAHSILAWANVAIHANPDYQVVFPPDVEFATFHAKNQFSRWPVSTETFNRQDYTAGVDVSRWQSHAAPTSFFAWDARGDFLAGYDHAKDAGVAFVADSHFVPGKKLWTWGTGSEGKLWERILTDADGPYAELMVGAFSDNQPDYSWIQPYETRAVTQTWFPVRGLGGVVSAGGEGACNLTVDAKRTAHIGYLPTRSLEAVRVALRTGDREIFRETFPAGPERPYKRDLALPPDVREDALELTFTAADGREILAYHRTPRKSPNPLPQVVESPRAPKDIATNEELFLTGLRIEQIHSPSFEPYPYYEEALRRDAGDYRANTALGLLYLKRAMYAAAEKHLRAAVERAARNYVRPKDGEALFYLGLSLRAQGRTRDAEDAFLRASWSLAWRSAGLFQCAELSAARGDLARALDLADRSLETNALNGKALGLTASLHRRDNRTGEAAAAIDKALALDPLDVRALYEMYLLRTADALYEDAGRVFERWRAAMRGAEPNALELAADYGACGLWDEAIGVLDRFAAAKPASTPAPASSGAGIESRPLVHYFMAYYLDRKGNGAKAADELARAAALPPDFGFPFQAECVDVLRWAEARNPKDGRAPYYLGNFLFDIQPEAAFEEWTKATLLDSANSMALRNLGLATARLKNDVAAASVWYEKALAANPRDPKLYFEYDQLQETLRAEPEKRLALLERNREVVAQRDDALTRLVQLLVLTGRYDDAIGTMASHHFHVWEGGGGIHGLFVDAHLLRGRKLLDAGNPRAALKDFEAAATYPPNLDVAEPRSGAVPPKIQALIDRAKQAIGRGPEAVKSARPYQPAQTSQQTAPAAESAAGPGGPSAPNESCTPGAPGIQGAAAGGGTSVAADPSGYYREAAEIAKWLDGTAIKTAAGLAWPSDPRDPKTVNTSLYAGTPGVVLFYLEADAAAKYFGKEAPAPGAFLQKARGGADELIARIAAEPGTGLYEGLGGMGFVLEETYKATREAKYRKGFLDCLEAIAAKARPKGKGVEWGSVTDIISGSAGTGLVLLYAFKETGDRRWLDLAAKAGDRLLELGTPKNGGLDWAMDPSVPRIYPNFSHGTAGGAFFLARLSEATGKKPYLDASLAGAKHLLSIAKTDGDACLIFHDEPGGKDLYYLGWCHGPVGTAHLFYELFKVTRDTDWMDWVEKSARGLMDSGIPEKETPGFWNNAGICCGLAGVADFFRALHRLSKNEEHILFGLRAVDALRRKATGDAAGMRWVQAEHRVRPELLIAQTGLMQGAAGIGLVLLRFAAEGGQAGRSPVRILLPDSAF